MRWLCRNLVGFEQIEFLLILLLSLSMYKYKSVDTKLGYILKAIQVRWGHHFGYHVML